MEKDALLFYISGHGLGHASRVSEVIKACKKRLPAYRIILRTGAPKWFFDFTFPFEYEYHGTVLDVGAVQYDFSSVDVRETLVRYERLHVDRSLLLERERDFIIGSRVRLVCSDIVPLAFDAAHEAGVPSIAHSNFSWDWIYRPYVASYPEYAHLVDGIASSYAKADRLLRLPLSGDMSVFREIVDIPFVARKSGKDKGDIRKRLNIPRDRGVVFLTFGGMGIDVDALRPAGTAQEFLFITTQPVRDTGSAVKSVPNELLKELDLGFEDLLAASDVVMSKPGYGTVAECIANGTRIVFCDREDFIERDAIVEGIRKYLNGVEIPKEELFSGNWLPYIERALASGLPVPAPPVDGAARAAGHIESCL